MRSVLAVTAMVDVRAVLAVPAVPAVPAVLAVRAVLAVLAVLAARSVALALGALALPVLLLLREAPLVLYVTKRKLIGWPPVAFWCNFMKIFENI